MKNESMGNFLPCVCTIANTHMPAVAVVSINEPNKVYIETVRVDWKTPNPLEAYNKAMQDYHDALSGCKHITDLDQRIGYIVTSLREKGYALTPKTTQDLIFRKKPQIAITNK